MVGNGGEWWSLGGEWWGMVRMVGNSENDGEWRRMLRNCWNGGEIFGNVGKLW